MYVMINVNIEKSGYVLKLNKSDII